MTTTERIALLVRLADGSMEDAFALNLVDRDQYRRRALAAEKALSELRRQFERVMSDWHGSAISGEPSDAGT